MPLTTQDVHRVVLFASDGITPLVTADGIKTTVADGANVALGAKADAAITNPALSASEIALLKGLLTQLQKTTSEATQIQGTKNTASGNCTGNNQDIIGPLDCTGYRQVVIQAVSSSFSGTTQPQLSLDGGTTWNNLRGSSITAGSLAASIVTTAINVYNLPPSGLFRLRSTAYTSGSLLCTAYFSAIPATFDVTPLTTINSQAGSSDAVAASTTGLATTALNLLFDPLAATWERQRVANVFKTVALGSGTTETTIWTPTASKKFNLMGMVLTCGAASTLTFKDNTAGTTIFIARGTTDVPIVVPQMSNGILSAAANNVLTVTRGTACTLDGVVWGTEE